jgi:hypothetical protein
MALNLIEVLINSILNIVLIRVQRALRLKELKGWGSPCRRERGGFNGLTCAEKVSVDLTRVGDKGDDLHFPATGGADLHVNIVDVLE